MSMQSVPGEFKKVPPASAFGGAGRSARLRCWTVRTTLSEGSLGAVADSVSVLLKRFSTIVRDIQETAREVSTGTLQVASTVQQVSQEATRQSSALTTGAHAIGDLSASAASVSQRTQAAMKVSARALD